jgi:uncharacterized lipoprotein YajG
MSWILSCKTKDKRLKLRLEQYARANKLSKSKAIEILLKQALKDNHNNGFTAGIPNEKEALKGLLRLIAELEAKTKEMMI